MMRSMFSGVSGLRVHQSKMDVIANNIANVNTVGFKSSRVTFRDAFYQNLAGASGANPVTGRTGTNPMQVGLGANVASIDNIMTQGLSQRTDNSMDVMIQGNGFFVVEDGSGTFFTRAGNISRDASNYLNINGMQLMGWDTTVGADGQPEVAMGPVQPLRLDGDKQNVPPKPTSLIDIAGNLNMNEMVTRPVVDASVDPPITYNLPTVTTNFAFYDTDGNMYTADVRFTYYPEDTDTPNHKTGFWEFEFLETPDGTDVAGTNGISIYKEDDRELEEGEEQKKAGIQIGPLATGGAQTLTTLRPRGVLVFDTEGELTGWASTTTGQGGGQGTNPLSNPAFQDADGDFNLLLLNDPATGPIAKENLRAHAATNNVAEMEVLIAPISILDPPASFGESTETMVHYDYTAGVGTPGGAPSTGTDGSVDVRLGRITMDVTDLNQWGGDNFSLTPVMADGNAPGTLDDLSVGTDGKITGRYSNGQTKLLGQICVAKFANPAGLQKVGNNLYAVTANSGPFNGIGDTGDILGGSLEMSNVDLSQEFTEMITTQRGFQANSRIITVSDEILQELVNLKR